MSLKIMRWPMFDGDSSLEISDPPTYTSGPCPECAKLRSEREALIASLRQIYALKHPHATSAACHYIAGDALTAIGAKI